MLYIDFQPGQTCHSKDGRNAYSIGVDELGWQCGTGLKSHGTITNWCTGRGWPVNCMTVISTQWRSKHAITKEWALNYYITRWIQEVSLFGDQTSWWQDAVEKASTQQRDGLSGLRLSSPGEREKTLMAIRVKVNMMQFCSVSNSLSHTNLSNKVRGIFFQELCRSSLLCRRCYDFACVCIWVCNSRCFLVFRDSYVIDIWVMNILCIFHIFMYSYVTSVMPA